MRTLMLGCLCFGLGLATAGDMKAGEKKAQLCLLCHKPDNAAAAAPLLEAQPAKYLEEATLAYKTGRRRDPAMQTNAVALSARDIKDIAAYFASRPPVTGVFSPDGAKASAGALRARELCCEACHGSGMTGAGGTPRLAGQTTGYIVSQLESFAAGRRSHPDARMPKDATDIESVAHFLTSLK